MLEKLMNNPYAWAILSVIAIIGFVLSIVFYFKGKEKKELSYFQDTKSLIYKKRSNIDKLLVTYNGESVESLCTSVFTIWNSGNRTLNKADMVDTKELTVSARNDCRILDYGIVKCSEDTNDFVLQVINEQEVKILFDYIDRNEGVKIQLIHTGTKNDLDIGCKIKGGVLKNISYSTKHIFSEKSKAVGSTAIVSIVFSIVYYFTTDIFSQNSFIASIAAFLLVAPFYVILVFVNIQEYKIPKSLRNKDE